MIDNAYHVVSRWRVEGTSGEVADILRDPLALPRWWPAVHLEVNELVPPDVHGVGQRVRLRSKGWLPYTIDWEFVVSEMRYPNRITIDAFGDFVGQGVWTIEQDGVFVNATYDWRITAEKPLLQRLSPYLRPLFEANHRWAMGQGETSLQLELLRRRAGTADGRRAVPPPPGPITYAAVGLLAGAALIGGTLGMLVLRQRRKARRRRNREPKA